MVEQPIFLTEYSHGAGCGCKIAPQVLDEILRSATVMPGSDKLVVGNQSKDAAAGMKKLQTNTIHG